MKKFLGLLTGLLILFGSAGVGLAGGHSHCGRSSFGFSFGFPGYYYGGCYRPAPVYYAPAPVYYAYPPYGYYSGPVYGYGPYYPGYGYSYISYGW